MLRNKLFIHYINIYVLLLNNKINILYYKTICLRRSMVKFDKCFQNSNLNISHNIPYTFLVTVLSEQQVKPILILHVY